MDEMKSGSKTLKKDGCYGIDFEDVTFNYTSGGKDALTSVNLHLEPGTVNAFVGPSGAGKTTAVQLLGRYWDTTGGTIKVGGVPITDLKTENLMDLTAFVFQDVFLLEDTLLEISVWEPMPAKKKYGKQQGQHRLTISLWACRKAIRRGLATRV